MGAIPRKQWIAKEANTADERTTPEILPGMAITLAKLLAIVFMAAIRTLHVTPPLVLRFDRVRLGWFEEWTLWGSNPGPADYESGALTV